MRYALIAVFSLWSPVVCSATSGFEWIVVMAEEAKLRVDGDVCATVPRGTTLLIQKRHFDGRKPTGWYWVRWKTEGWIHKNDVLPIDRALTYFTEAIDKEPTAEAYNIRGWIWRLHFQFDKAIADFDEAISLRPDVAESLYRRGVCWACKRESERAISDYSEAIRLDPKLARAYEGRGKVWKRMKEHDKALADFTEAIRLDPSGSAYPYFRRGELWNGKGEYAKAIADYSEAIRLYPNVSFPYDPIARILATCPDAERRDGERAIEYATRACELSRRDYRCIDTLAAAHAETGDFACALEWQQKAIDMAPDDQEEALRSRLELYKSGKPFRMPAQVVTAHGKKPQDNSNADDDRQQDCP